ncbi:dna polymerase iii subunits gamma and tau [Fusarium albosuccineum]|uniref:Dna polymerase iii subunits gamma and tau n=1 Tax=Fusarium albosuccineum TaxID=1237068 RepID=A0A8H4PDT5_9HYPO|nr:dna polymerase iii subunits gamma and tau [Fusarium albosuccineum]
MFAVQSGFDQRKRAREEEELAANGSMNFGEHRNKRVQCLPLRTSPRVSQQWLPSSSMTPQNSDSDEQYQQNNFSQWSSSTGMPQQYSDMDMVQQQHNAGRLGAVSAEADNANGRMPTPIQPSFAAQVRGQPCEWAGPDSTTSTMNGVANLGHHQTGFANSQSVPRTMATGWQAVQNNRRLPSPISECDDSMAGQPITPTGMEFDISAHGNPSPDMAHPNVHVEHSPPLEHHNAMMDVEAAQAGDADGDPTTPSPRRGHIRSRHTVNNWTWQPGMKKSFSIGYRSDCEKCRLKVPGHFNHIIIS